MKQILRAGAATLLGIAGLSTQAAALPFTFTKIADSTVFGVAAGAGFGGAQINAGGTVAFLGSPGGTVGIFTGNGVGGAQTIVQQGGTFSQLGNFAINAGGTVAFIAEQNTGLRGIFAGTPDPVLPIVNIATIVDSSGPLRDFGTDDINGIPSINTGGTAAFLARFDTGGLGIFTDTVPGGTNTIATANNTGPIFTLGDGPAINDAGEVAFTGLAFTGLLDNDNNPINANGVFVASPNPITPTTDIFRFADDTGTFASFSRPSINASGVVAFQARLDAGGQGIFTSGGPGLVAPIADDSGAFLELAFPAINAGGTVAFIARLDPAAGGGTGIFLGDDPLADFVIRTGDALDGSVVTSLGFFRGLNDAGQIAFLALLADGRGAVFRADPLVTPDPDPDPVAAPQPAALLLFGSGLLGLGWLRRRRPPRAE